WRESAVADFGEATGAELARLAELERESWAAWERSKVARERTRTKRAIRPARGSSAAAGPAGEGVASIDSAELAREGRGGDPRFLAVVLSCIKQRAELLGLSAPARLELMGKGGGPVEARVEHRDVESDLRPYKDVILSFLEEGRTPGASGNGQPEGGEGPP